MRLINLNRLELCDEILAHLNSEDFLSAEEKKLKVVYESSFYEFAKACWSTIEGINRFVDNWHIKGFCDHLQACKEGRIRMLLCNIPPRCMKSTIKSMFIAWVWTTCPHHRFINVSGDINLLIKDNMRSKDIIVSDWYQRFWGSLFHIRKDINSKKRFANNKGGVSLVKSIRSSSIGEGGNYIILDDANSAQDLDSDKQRQRTTDTFDSTISFRFDSTDHFSLINIQQRLHEYDLTGHIKSTRKEYVHFCLPMEFVRSRACVTIPLKDGEAPWRDPRVKEKELLWPDRFSRDYVDNVFKTGLRTVYNIEAQLQQNPHPPEGGILQRDWFQVWTAGYIPQMDYIISSWDTALGSQEEACYSAITTWGIFKNDQGIPQVMLLNCWRGRVEMPDLRFMIKKCYNNIYTRRIEGDMVQGVSPDILLIEEANNSKALIDDLRRARIPVTSFSPRWHGLKNPTTNVTPISKIGRARLASLPFNDGFVWVREKDGHILPAAEDFIAAAIKFPRGDGADYVDSMSQAFIFMMKKEFIHLRGEMPPPQEIDYQAMNAQYER
jgi:phage terminase large subunit-like protein